VTQQPAPPAASSGPTPSSGTAGGSSPAAPKPTKAHKPSADLSVRLGGPAKVRTGRTFTERLTVTNHGPHRAKHVHVRLHVPHGLTITDAAGASRHGRTLRWGIGALAAHATRTYTLTFTVSTHRSGHRTIQAVVRSLATHDRHTRNNHRKDRIRIVRPH
jgi:hypothetical protein